MESELEGSVRLEKTGGKNHQLREKGMIPAIVYGKNLGSISIAVDGKDLKKILEEAGSNALINMKIKDNGKTKKCKVLVKAVQRDPVRRDLIHVDFHQISLKDKVHAAVPVHLVGLAPGVAAGGILNPQLRRVEVECLATKIPDAINVDISSLDIGDVITVADLILPPEVKVLEEHSTPVVSVSAASKAAAEAVPAGEAKEEKTAQVEETREEAK
ncbi:MAG: 50S ribosomal protein L25/general stress protein Ctc [Desulfotomaculaceae bacterium]